MPQAKRNTQTTENSPRERFARLATIRTNKAIQALDQIGQLANPNNYQYTDDDIKVIESELLKHVTQSMDALRARKRPSALQFKIVA